MLLYDLRVFLGLKLLEVGLDELGDLEHLEGDLELLEGDLCELERLVRLVVDLAKLAALADPGELADLAEPVLPLAFLDVSALLLDGSASSGSALVSPASPLLLAYRLPRGIAPCAACVGGR